MSDKEYGKCFYCEENCNILSQACRTCMKKLTKAPTIIYPKYFYEKSKGKKMEKKCN